LWHNPKQAIWVASKYYITNILTTIIFIHSNMRLLIKNIHYALYINILKNHDRL
jgi:hypothetical protein